MENTYYKNSSVIPGKFNIYRSCIKSSIVVLNTTKCIKSGLEIILISIFNFNYQFQLFHSIQYLSQYNKAKGTIFFKRDYFCICYMFSTLIGELLVWHLKGKTHRHSFHIYICLLSTSIHRHSFHICICLLSTSIHRHSFHIYIYVYYLRLSIQIFYG